MRAVAVSVGKNGIQTWAGPDAVWVIAVMPRLLSKLQSTVLNVNMRK